MESENRFERVTAVREVDFRLKVFISGKGLGEVTAPTIGVLDLRCRAKRRRREEFQESFRNWLRKNEKSWIRTNVSY